MRPRAERLRAMGRLIALAVNVAVRLWTLYFLAEVMLSPDDPRFAGKAIAPRNLAIVLSASMLFPAMYLWRWRGERRAYPVWHDSLYLSIFWLDMAGNSFNLYDRYYYFDLIPHTHGPGALAVVLRGAFGFPALSAAGLVNLIHTGLEVQEYYTDVLADTHNVRGQEDTVNDLAVGLVGMLLYLGGQEVVRRWRRIRPL